MCAQTVKKSYRSVTGYFASRKNKRQAIFTSTLERKWFLLLEFDDNVVSYKEQPFKIYYSLDDMRTRYTPDIQVDYKDGPSIIYEVKYQSEIDADVDLQHKLDVLKDIIPEQKSLPFKLLTDTQIDMVYFDNCRFLYQFYDIQEEPQFIEELERILEENDGYLSVQEIVDMVGLQSLEAIAQLWRFVFYNRYLIDMHKRLTMATSIATKEIKWQR